MLSKYFLFLCFQMFHAPMMTYSKNRGHVQTLAAMLILSLRFKEQSQLIPKMDQQALLKSHSWNKWSLVSLDWLHTTHLSLGMGNWQRQSISLVFNLSIASNQAKTFCFMTHFVFQMSGKQGSGVTSLK
jgi:hypothetical protein